VKLASEMSDAEYQAARAAMLRQSREAKPDVKAEPAAELTPKDRIDAELTALATGAGLVDLDWLKLADLSTVRVGKSGAVEGAVELVESLKKAKPHLFAGGTTSTPGRPPASGPLQTRDALTMSPEEYAKSKAALIRENRLNGYR
jgi:hypothetical protein